MDILKLYDELHAICAAYILDGEELPPQVVRLTTSGKVEVHILGVPKAHWAAVQSCLFKMEDTVAVGLVTEGWMVKAQAGKPLPSLPPSQCPDRVEIVSFYLTEKDGTRWWSACEIGRPSNVLVKEPLEAMKDGVSLSGAVVMPDQRTNVPATQ